MKYLTDFEKGQTVEYIGDNEVQKGEHKILDVDETGLYLGSNYTNGKYYIIDRYNLDKIKKV